MYVFSKLILQAYKAVPNLHLKLKVKWLDKYYVMQHIISHKRALDEQAQNYL